jgi:hypothetical protein
LRLIGHITAVLAIVLFVRGLVIYGADVSAAKTFCFGILLFGWWVVTPLVKDFVEWVPRESKSAQVKYKIQSFLDTYVFLPIVVVAFIWMIFTTWRRADREYGLGEFLRTVTSRESPAR